MAKGRITSIKQTYSGSVARNVPLTAEEIAKLKIKPEYANMGLPEILADSDLAFDVVLDRGAITNPITGQMQALESYSTFRADTYAELGNGFSANYAPLSYLKALEGVFGNLRELGAVPTRAISLKHGRSAAIQLILPDTYYGGGVSHRQFAQMFASHDGTQGVLVNSSDVTIICANTYAMAKADKSMRHSAKHTQNIMANLGQIHAVITAQTALEMEFMGFLDQAALVNAEKMRPEFVDYILEMPKERAETKRVNSAKDNQKARLQLAIDTSVSERNGANATAFDLFQGVTRAVTYRWEGNGKKDDSEVFEYVMANPKPQEAREWLTEKIAR